MRRDVSLPHRQSGRAWLWVLGVLAACAILAVALAPFAIEWAAQKWLRAHGHATANLEDVDFNPFTGRLVLDVLVAGDGEGGQLNAQRIAIDLAWRPLWRYRVLLEAVEVEDAVIEIRLDEAGRLSLGRLLLAPLLVADQTKETPAWEFGLESLALRNVRLIYVQPLGRTEVLVERADIGQALRWSPNSATPYTLQLTLGGGKIRFRGDMKPFADEPSLSADLEVDNLPLVWLHDTVEVLEQRGIESLDGKVGAELTGTFLYRPTTESMEFVASGSLEVGELRARSPAFQLRDATVDWDGRIALAGPVAAPTVTASGTLAATNVSGLASQANLEISQSSLQWRGELEFTANSDRPWTGEGEVLGSGLEVRLPGDPTPIVEIGTAALTGARVKGGTGVEATRLDLTQTRWIITDPGQPPYTVSVETLQLPELSVDLDPDGEVTLSSGLHVRDWQIRGGPQAASLLQIRTLELGGLRATVSGRLKVAALSASTVQLFEAPVSDTRQAPFLITLGQVSATDLNAQETALSLADLRLSDIRAILAIDANGDSGIGKWLGASSEDADSNSAPGFALHVGQVELDGDNRIAFRDAGVSPTVKLDLGFSGNLRNLDTAPGIRQTQIVLRARLGEFSSLTFDGSAALMAERPTVRGTVELAAIPLERFDPYVRRLTGHRLVTGQLDAEIDLQVDAGQLDSEARLVLHQLELEPVDAELAEELSEQLGVSLERALALLRDKNDDIRLAIPVQGDLDNPDLSFRDAIRQALRKGTVSAIKSGVLTYFAPVTVVGAVFAAGKLFEQGKGMQLKPVEFEAGRAQLAPGSTGYLDETAGLLADRPQVRLRLCGVATALDRSAAAPDSGPLPGADSEPLTTEPAAPTALSPEMEEALLGLAQQRAVAVKQYLVDPGGIDPERLFVCSPLLDEAEGARPRVDLSL